MAYPRAPFTRTHVHAAVVINTVGPHTSGEYDPYVMCWEDVLFNRRVSTGVMGRPGVLCRLNRWCAVKKLIRQGGAAAMAVAGEGVAALTAVEVKDLLRDRAPGWVEEQCRRIDAEPAFRANMGAYLTGRITIQQLGNICSRFAAASGGDSGSEEEDEEGEGGSGGGSGGGGGGGGGPPRGVGRHKGKRKPKTISLVDTKRATNAGTWWQ